MNIGLGTASFGTTYSEAESFAVLDRFVELGGTIIDTANNYAFWTDEGRGGESEAVIGRWLKGRDRSKLEIHTKMGFRPLDGSNPENGIDGLSRVSVPREMAASLERLGLDYVDVLFAHVDDESVPLLESWGALTALVREGQVRRLGVSNYRPDRLATLIDLISDPANNLAPISYMQIRHSLITPKPSVKFGIQVVHNNDLAQIVRQAPMAITIVPYSPLVNGAFENRDGELWDAYDTPANRQIINQIQAEADERGITPSALVLGKLGDEGMLPLTMTRNVQRLETNLACFL